jgi:hypothetical protein
MKHELLTATTPDHKYAVAVDRCSLTETELLGLGKGYSIALTGTIDANWLGCYRKLRVDSPSFFRFCLEDGKILFACRSGDVLTDVESILRILDMLLLRANELASASRPSE